MIALTALLAVGGVISFGIGRATHRAGPAANAAADPARGVPGERDRVVVEVLNASGATGAARLVTGRLRDAGLDVVYYASDARDDLDSTEILLRRGGVEAAERVQRALGAGRVRAAPDPSRLVDVSVRLGRDLAATLRDP